MADEAPIDPAASLAELLASPDLREITKDLVSNPSVKQRIDAAGAAMRVGEEGFLIRKIVAAGVIEEDGEMLPIVKHVEGDNAGQPFAVDDTMILTYEPWVPYQGDTEHHGPTHWSVEEAENEVGIRVVLPLTGMIVDVTKDDRGRAVAIIEVDDRFGIDEPHSFKMSALMDGLVPAPFLMSEEEKEALWIHQNPGQEVPESFTWRRTVHTPVTAHDLANKIAEEGAKPLTDLRGNTAEQAGVNSPDAYLGEDGMWCAPPAEEKYETFEDSAPAPGVKDGPAIVGGDDD